MEILDIKVTYYNIKRSECEMMNQMDTIKLLNKTSETGEEGHCVEGYQKHNFYII